MYQGFKLFKDRTSDHTVFISYNKCFDSLNLPVSDVEPEIVKKDLKLNLDLKLDLLLKVVGCCKVTSKRECSATIIIKVTKEASSFSTANASAERVCNTWQTEQLKPRALNKMKI